MSKRVVCLRCALTKRGGAGSTTHTVHTHRAHPPCTPTVHTHRAHTRLGRERRACIICRSDDACCLYVINAVLVFLLTSKPCAVRIIWYQVRDRSRVRVIVSYPHSSYNDGEWNTYYVNTIRNNKNHTSTMYTTYIQYQTRQRVSPFFTFSEARQ